jgi:hypothetical protein
MAGTPDVFARAKSSIDFAARLPLFPCVFIYFSVAIRYRESRLEKRLSNRESFSDRRSQYRSKRANAVSPISDAPGPSTPGASELSRRGMTCTELNQ